MSKTSKRHKSKSEDLRGNTPSHTTARNMLIDASNEWSDVMTYASGRLGPPSTWPQWVLKALWKITARSCEPWRGLDYGVVPGTLAGHGNGPFRYFFVAFCGPRFYRGTIVANHRRDVELWLRHAQRVPEWLVSKDVKYLAY